VKVSEKERFSLDDNTSQWGNTVVGLQLNHIFSENFSMVHYLNLNKIYPAIEPELAQYRLFYSLRQIGFTV